MTGYNESFLDGIKLPLPTFSLDLKQQILQGHAALRNGMIQDYITYSVVMNRSVEKRSPAFVALNIDQNLLKKTKRSNDWKIDTTIGPENQLDNAYYANNRWDRGHMARRASAAHGNTVQAAQRADDATFYYTNSCLQHENLNQDEWLALEEWVYNLNLDADGKLTEFSGPFYGNFDRSVIPTGRPLALAPAGFFKIVCFKNKDTLALDVRAFVMYQDVETLKDKNGKKLFNNQTYQVSVTEIERLTGLQFDDAIYEANPLFFDPTNAPGTLNIPQDSGPESHEVADSQDILDATQPRQTIHDDIVDVFISCAMVNPTGTDQSNEWVSLTNLGGTDVDLTDWTLKDKQNRVLQLNSVLTTTASRILKPGMACMLKPIDPLQLANTGGVIKLYDASQARIDWVNYTSRMVASGKPVVFLAPRDTLK